jgi:predicted deacylase
MVAGVHGDEFEGIRALAELSQEVGASQLQGTLVIVPVVNMPAYRAGQRTSPLDGWNLSRTTPGKPDGSPTERLGYALFHRIVRGSDLVVDLHSAGTRYTMLPLACFTDLPSEAGRQSWLAACAMGLEGVWELPRWPGILTYEAVRHEIPACGAEIGGMGRCLEKDAALYKRAVYRLLAHMEMLALPRPSYTPARILTGEWLLSQASGFFRAHCLLGEEVVEGRLLGTIHNVYGDVVAEIKAPWFGLVASVRTFSAINVGEWTVAVCQDREAPAFE